MWDKERINPAFEIGSSVTNSSGYFDYNTTDFLGALTGFNEIYAASYKQGFLGVDGPCLLYTSPSPRDLSTSRMPSSA